MKLKKTFLTSTVAITSASLISIVATSCSKSHIDDDLKINLNDEGLFNDPITDTVFSYKDAISSALKRSSSWTTFKNALADEVVYKWYTNRAADDKHPNRNKDFKKNLTKWEYNADKDYKNALKTCRTKYGANYNFYLQNNYLSAYGGTKESYIHAKILEEVKKEFTRLLFEHNYFGIAKPMIGPTLKYPAIYSDTNPRLLENALNNPTNWPKIGFYAKTQVGFNPGSTESQMNLDYLCKNPDGDFAILQDYIFNCWYETEKPFFSAAALFGFSNPTSSSQEKKLSDIYNENRLSSKLPENPNESFPFYGGISIDNDDDKKGYLTFWQWYWDLYNGNYEIKWLDSQSIEHWNGTISMPKSSTDDSQTLLLCSAKTMFDDLYTPYAIAAATLYQWLVNTDGSTYEISPINKLTQNALEANVGDINKRPEDKDDDRILKNFFFRELPSGINSYLDLSKIYPLEKNTYQSNDEEIYHCPLFAENDNFKFFYGDSETPSVKYATNSFAVELGKSGGDTNAYVDQQPWILEMNEAGVHAQTIDGYFYATHDMSTPAFTQTAFNANKFKNVFKYRLLQSITYNQDKLISADVFGDSGKLKKYFDDNYADIILNLAILNGSSSEPNVYNNIFRDIESYDDNEQKNDDLLLNRVYKEQKFGADDNYTLLINYVNLTHNIDLVKNQTDAVEAIDSKIYSYRSTQITNHTSQSGKKHFDNGLSSPIVAIYKNNQNFKASHHYYEIIDKGIFKDEIENIGEDKLTLLLKTLDNNDFINLVTSASVNTSSAGSPQIKKAKKVQSNRFWYYSSVVDKTMYSFMGNNTLANGIKIKTYSEYEKQFQQLQSIIGTTGAYKPCVYSTYATSKLLNGTDNFGSYTNLVTNQPTFYTTMSFAFENFLRNASNANGEFNDELLNFELFKSTVAYLAKDEFKNLYKYLDTRIQKNETAYVGYLRKFDLYDPLKSKYTNDLASINGDNSTPYDWSADVGNIFDRDEYAGQTDAADPSISSTSYAINYDQYWHVIEKTFTNPSSETDPIEKTFAGFLGIQTKRQNDLDEASGIRAAAFDHFARSTNKSYDLSGNIGGTINQNKGSLFPWAGRLDKSGEEYTFDDVYYPNTQDKITKGDVSSFNSEALKLAFSITEMDTKDDLMELAKSLADAIYGPSVYSDIAQGDVELDPTDIVQSLKFRMLEPLKKHDIEPYYFDRIKDVELHDSSNNPKYYFEDGLRNGYRVMLTQINKSDVTETKLTPKWEGGTWVFDDKCPLQPEEFWFILANAACDRSNQDLAVSDAIKTIFGEKKLIVYDAQLYNQFDSIWIKNWQKKPIGGGE